MDIRGRTKGPYAIFKLSHGLCMFIYLIWWTKQRVCQPLVYCNAFFRILASIEHFASTANLSDTNSSLIIQPDVALAIYCVSDTIRIRGIAVLTDALPDFDYENVIPLTKEMAENGRVSRVDSAIILSEEVIDLLKEMKGILKKDSSKILT